MRLTNEGTGSRPQRGVSPGLLRAIGVVSLGLFAAWAAEATLRGHWEDILWACAAGLFIVGVGLAARSATLGAVGTLLVGFGTALWIVELIGGRPWTWFSVVLHGGGLLAGALGVRSLGLPRGAWWKGVLTLLALQLLSRWITPPEANINLAFRVHEGWEGVFPTYGSYQATLVASGAALLFAGERLLRRVAAPAPAPQDTT